MIIDKNNLKLAIDDVAYITFYDDTKVEVKCVREDEYTVKATFSNSTPQYITGEDKLHRLIKTMSDRRKGILNISIGRASKSEYKNIMDSQLK
jgi:hypothetical protein